MPRIRFFDHDDPAETVAWQTPALIIATLFINVPFWFIQVTGSMVVATALSVAAHALQGGTINMAIALVTGLTRQREKAVLAIFALTILGLLRFGVAAIKLIPTRQHWLLFACLFSATVWCSLHPDRQILQHLFGVSTVSLAAAAAILTVDAMIGVPPRAHRRINWPATLALLCAIVIPAFCRFWWADPYEETWHFWLLPSYGIAFLCRFLLGPGGQAPDLLTLNKKEEPEDSSL